MGNAWIALRLPGGRAYCPFILETKLDTYMGPSVRCIAGNRNPTIFNIIRWVAGSVGRKTHPPLSDVPSIIFFHYFFQNSLQKYFQSISLFLFKNTKIKVKIFECPKSIKSLKNNTWNIRRLVDDSFVQSAQRPSVNLS